MTASVDDTLASDGSDDETVLVFGGRGRMVYHAAWETFDGELRPRCGARGGNLFEKERSLIESHYDPCANCYHDGDASGER